eukprot:11189546-Lingulodinium_polyedra.AAC.1
MCSGGVTAPLRPTDGARCARAAVPGPPRRPARQCGCACGCPAVPRASPAVCELSRHVVPRRAAVAGALPPLRVGARPVRSAAVVGADRVPK